MTVREFEVEVTQVVKVQIDDEKINEDFNRVFSSYMWDVNCIEDHVKHLAQMEARGLIDCDGYVEGYGRLPEIGCASRALKVSHIKIFTGC